MSQAQSSPPESESRRERWNRRYSQPELVWGAGPNQFIFEVLSEVEPAGRSLDLACGEGRNSIWLASRGWQASGVDFAGVALERARTLARERDVEVDFAEHDLTEWQPEAGAFALVVIAYLQIPRAQMNEVWAAAARALAPGGELVAVGHAARNLADGTGGPQDPDVLWGAESVRSELEGAGLRVDRLEEVLRAVDDARPAIDLLVRARRPGSAEARD
jgi:SAM-dependent methyltransferase